MLSITLGPLAFPVAPLLLIAAVWGASWLASRLAGRDHADAAANAVGLAAFAGLLAARLAHVALNLSAYAPTPWSMLDVRDGGWHVPAGFAAGTAWLAWRALRRPALRRPVALAAFGGGVAWAAATAALGGGALREQPPLPALALVDHASGAPVELAQATAGRPAVVNLWATWCPPCREEMPMLAAAQRRESGVTFLFVNQGESASAIRAYLVDQDLDLSNALLDAAKQLGPLVGSRGLPTTLFYDARGRLVDAHLGVLNAAALESRLRTLRAGAR